MPEIPEMETYKNFLNEYAVGRMIVETEVTRERSINVDPEFFRQSVKGRLIEGVERKGKLLQLRLSNGKFLLAHMMLDGRIYLEREGKADLPGTSHVRLMLDEGSVLHFCDLRLGYLKLMTQTEINEVNAQLGIDPLGSEYDFSVFQQLLNRKKGMIKPLLMDQKVIAGIGNAYSNETLFRAGILPERKTFTLSMEEREGLFKAIPEILRLSIDKGGYIEEPFYSGDTLSGGFIPYFKVYDRTGEDCYTCGLPIQQKTVGGRNAYYCMNCQH